MKTYQTILLFIFTAIFITGCSSSNSTAEKQAENKSTIYTSIYPIQYAVERIGGDTFTVKSVYPPGGNAHTFEPSSKEIISIAKGDAFFYLGAGLEGFAESAADALQDQKTELIEIGKHEELFLENAAEEESPDHHDHDNHGDDSDNHSDIDPHIWLDPNRMIDMAAIIKEQMIKLYPENKELYSSNFAAFEKDLKALDNQFKETLQPKKESEILVSHGAYGYWEDRYNIKQIAISGISSSEEPSQKKLKQIVDTAQQHDLNYVIFEQNGSDRVSSIIQEQIGAKPLYIHNLSVLTKEDITNGENYFSLMEKNLKVLDKATNQEE